MNTHKDPILSALADHLDSPLWFEDELVTGALATGRRTVQRRRLVAGAGITAAAVATVGLGWSAIPREQVDVAAQPSPVPVTSQTPLPASVPDPRRPIPATPGMKAIVASHLPGKSIKYTYSQEIQALSMEVTDAKGTSWAAIGMDDVRWHPYSAASCRQAGCVTTKVGAATMATSIDTEKAGQGMWSFLQRPDQRVIWFGQQGALEHKVTRPGHLLTQQQVAALLSDPRWDKELVVVPTELAPDADPATKGPTPAAAPTKR